MRTNKVKSELKNGRAQVGTWLSMSSPISARYMARAGWNWVTVDMEHSSVNWETAANIFALIADAGGIPLIRIPSISHEHAKRALDLGAYGIIFPMCNSVEEAELAVASCRYPTSGRRSVGGNLHALNFGASPSEYYAKANDEILVVIQAEHVIAVEQCEKILAVPGIDAVFIGPNDLLASMGKTPQMETNDPEFVEALERIRRTADRYGIAPGLHVGNAAAARRRLEEGWRMIAVNSDLGFMNEAASLAVSEIFGKGPAGLARY